MAGNGRSSLRERNFLSLLSRSLTIFTVAV